MGFEQKFCGRIEKNATLDVATGTFFVVPRAGYPTCEGDKKNSTILTLLTNSSIDRIYNRTHAIL